MRLVSWNVNGLRACVTKGFADTFRALDADIFCLQETKLQPGQITLELPGYHQYWCSAEKKGYSGTALFTKAEPLDVQYNLGLPQHDLEGRVITAEYPEFILCASTRRMRRTVCAGWNTGCSGTMRSASSSARSTGTSRS